MVYQINQTIFLFWSGNLNTATSIVLLGNKKSIQWTSAMTWEYNKLRTIEGVRKLLNKGQNDQMYNGDRICISLRIYEL
jgi:hypothetical protein